MEIRKYQTTDEQKLFEFLEREGEEWIGAWGEVGKPNYLKALESDFALIATVNNDVVGFARCIGSVEIYVDDLLVDKSYRGKEIGKKLMETVVEFFPEKDVFVLSDVDDYYSKLGYDKIGSVFQIGS